MVFLSFRPWAIAAVLGALSASSALADIVYAGGDGSSRRTAIKILGAASELEGVRAEFDWLKANRSSCLSSKQARIIEDGVYYDVLWVFCDMKQTELFFDVSDFAGKQQQ